MHIAVVGSRDFEDLDAVRKYVRELPNDVIIISGGARGVDTAAIEEATRIGLACKIYPADWNQYGKKAGIIRNQQIVDVADEIVAFWDGHSRGTKNTIHQAQRAGKRVTIINTSDCSLF
jgi:hypothetical protein